MRKLFTYFILYHKLYFSFTYLFIPPLLYFWAAHNSIQNSNTQKNKNISNNQGAITFLFQIYLLVHLQEGDGKPIYIFLLNF